MEELQARYSSETSQHHANLAACALAAGAPLRALEAIFAMKAGPLLDLRATPRVGETGGLALIEELKAGLARWRHQALNHRHAVARAAELGQAEAAAHHRARAEEAESLAEQAAQSLVATARALGDQGGVAAVPAPAAVAAMLPPGAALLEYAQLGDQLAACLLKADGEPHWRMLGPARAVDKLLDRWSLSYNRQRTGIASLAASATALAPLRALLLDPWAAELTGVRELFIAPSGVLCGIPWAALMTGTALDSLPLTITPCGAMLAAPAPVAAHPPGPPLLLGHGGQSLRPLAAVERELAAIAQAFPEATVRSPATTADIRGLERAPCLLHIAAHGLTNTAAPLCSTIELADGPLLLLEVYRLDLRGTGLVVLSACETGVRPDYGEMALALVGAFLCAGANAVVATLWPVDDEAAADLMSGFYKTLAAGASPPVALRAAQTSLRERHPLDWPAFQLWAGASRSV
jgi:CHAT domain-containing protein